MNLKRLLGLTFIVSGMVALLMAATLTADAQGNAGNPAASPIHPPVALLDADGVSVLNSGKPISTARTCGTCHDTAFIMGNSAHNRADLGFGLERLYPAPVEQSAAGGEMNCFLCHTVAPNNTERLAALKSEDIDWANTATLIGTGIVEQIGGQYRYKAEVFIDGTLTRETLGIQDPSSANCGQCHGMADHQTIAPLTLDACDANQFNTATTGQVFSPQKVSQSGLNVENKTNISRSFDIHAERVLKCTSCHYSLNNPVFYLDNSPDKPSHLQFDPRRMDFGEYLYRPIHRFAQGNNAQYSGTPSLAENTMRRCETCHDAAQSHTWLPYVERHTQTLACESCHIPQTYAPALQMVDFTVLTADGMPPQTCRGIDSEQAGTSGAQHLITGYQPILLPRPSEDGTLKLAPFNLITTYYWTYGENKVLPLDALNRVYLSNGTYSADVLAALDANQDKMLNNIELKLDTSDKVMLITSKLAALGYKNAKIAGEVQPFALNHGVAGGQWAIRECSTCHAEDSRINLSISLGGSAPNGVTPTFQGDNVPFSGSITTQSDGTLLYSPLSQGAAVDLYVFGHHRAEWADTVGLLTFLGVLGAVFTHGGLRFVAARQGLHSHPELKRVYMYGVYERGWHWVQTAAILLLILTGLVIHRPDSFPIFPFAAMVVIHNALALILVINAALSLFYHLASGQIKQFLPEPKGFFNDSIKQALFYMRGIFKGAPHPMEKTPERKLNPLQQLTYLGLLNVLLPAQIITGILMWGVQHFPDLAGSLGGLPFLAPLHSLIAWLFGSFIIAHVYLTTTGHEPLAGISAMITGWEDVESASQTSSD